jgi:predicted nucleic acid-binding protein
LSEFREAARELLSLSVRLLPLDATTLDAAADLSQPFGILTNDALIVTLLRHEGLVHLVTNDDDFDGLAGVTVWKPR